MRKNKSTGIQFEIRSVDAEKGIFEGYASVFDVVDTYGSKIMRGAFTKTLSERADKVKVMWNHDEDSPIGKPIEMREDSHGLFVKAQLTRGIQKAEEALLLMKDGVINTLSIGFSVPKGKDAIVDGIRQISEVKLFEFSPVVFESNSAAAITGVRSENFNETFNSEELERKHGLFLYALRETLEDIWWSNKRAADVVDLVAKAVGDFATKYKDWAVIYAPLTYHGDDEYRSGLPCENDLSKAVYTHIRNESITPENLAMTTSLTLDDVRKAKRGDVHCKNVAQAFGGDVVEAYRKQRRIYFEELTTHLRGGLNSAEQQQLSALLNLQPSDDDTDNFLAATGEPQTALTELMDEIRGYDFNNKKEV